MHPAFSSFVEILLGYQLGWILGRATEHQIFRWLHILRPFNDPVTRRDVQEWLIELHDSAFVRRECVSAAVPRRLVEPLFAFDPKDPAAPDVAALTRRLEARNAEQPREERKIIVVAATAQLVGPIKEHHRVFGSPCTDSDAVDVNRALMTTEIYLSLNGYGRDPERLWLPLLRDYEALDDDQFLRAYENDRRYHAISNRLLHHWRGRPWLASVNLSVNGYVPDGALLRRRQIAHAFECREGRSVADLTDAYEKCKAAGVPLFIY